MSNTNNAGLQPLSKNVAQFMGPQATNSVSMSNMVHPPALLKVGKSRFINAKKPKQIASKSNKTINITSSRSKGRQQLIPTDE